MSRGFMLTKRAAAKPARAVSQERKFEILPLPPRYRKSNRGC